MQVANAKLQCLFSMNCWSPVPLLWGKQGSHFFFGFLKYPFLLVLSLLFRSFLIRFIPWFFFFLSCLLLSTRVFILILFPSNWYICWEILTYHTNNLLNTMHSSFLARFLFYVCYSLMACFNTHCSLCLD